MDHLNFRDAALRVCVDAAEGGRLSGQVYAARLAAPLHFSDAGSLVLRIEEVLDSRNFPQAFRRTRTFSAKPAPHAEAMEPERGFSPAEVAVAQGGFATFTVNVTSRHSSTWQGSVDWLDGTPPHPFSSDLEFLRLLDERLPTSG